MSAALSQGAGAARPRVLVIEDERALTDVLGYNLKREGYEPIEAVEHLDVRIDRVRHRAFVGERELDLTPTEFRLLECMLRQPGRASW